MERSNAILKRKFLEYFLPAIISTMALSLSEFVDVMIVANLADAHAMAIVGLGAPVLYVVSTVYCLIGVGGSICYSVACGQMDEDKAGKIFFLTVVSSLVSGIFLLILGFVIFDPLSGLLCRDPVLINDFKEYLSALLFGVPFMTVSLSLSEFLVSCGAPRISMSIDISANIVNLIMDVVYIHIFDMGIKGAALATLTGYLVSFLLIMFFFLSRKVGVKIKKAGLCDLGELIEMAEAGSATAVSQMGYIFKTGYSNFLAAYYAGTAGEIAITVCFQALSISGIFLGAAMQVTYILTGVMHGLQDGKGEKLLLQIIMKWIAGIQLVCVILFAVFPSGFAALYNIKDDNAFTLTVHALPLFCLAFPVRGLIMVFMEYLQVVELRLYGLLVSFLDGIVFIFIFAKILCSYMGIDGLWWTYPLSAGFLMAICIAANLVIAKGSRGRFYGILLEEKQYASFIDATVLTNDEDIGKIIGSVLSILKNKNMSLKSCNRISLGLEETIIFLRNRLGNKSWLDIVAIETKDHVLLQFCSLGQRTDPNQDSSKDREENILLLKGISEKIEYDYIVGMNCMRVYIPFENKVEKENEE